MPTGLAHPIVSQIVIDAQGNKMCIRDRDYMLLHNMFYLVFAKNPSAEKQNLVRTDNLNYNNLVRFRADRIFLKPGFHATPSGSTAKLHIYPYDRYKINSYQQVAYQLSPCDQIQQNNQNIIPSHTPINTLEDLITCLLYTSWIFAN